MATDIGNAVAAVDKAGNWYMLHANGAMEAGSALTLAPVGYGAPLINPIGFNAGPYYKADAASAFPVGDFSFVTVVTIPSTVATSIDLLCKWDGTTLYFTLELSTTYTRFYVRSSTGVTAAADAGGPLAAGTYVIGGRYVSSTGLVTIRVNGANFTATATGGGVAAGSALHAFGANSIGGAPAPAGWTSWGDFFTEKQLSDADIDRIGAMGGSLTAASFLRINGITVSVLDGSANVEEPMEAGTSDRAADFSMRINRRTEKRKWSATIAHHVPNDFIAWKGLALGHGHTVSFEGPGGTATLYSTKGLPPNTVGAGASAENVPVNAKFGNGDLLIVTGYGISYQFFNTTQPQGWTIAAWVATGGGTTYHHYVGRSDGAWWQDGLSVSAPAWFFGVAAGNLSLFATPSTIRVDDLVALPFKVPDSWPAQMYAFGAAGNPFSDLGKLKIDGGFIENNTEVVNVRGHMTGAKPIQGYIGGVFYDNLHAAQIAFEEI